MTGEEKGLLLFRMTPDVEEFLDLMCYFSLLGMRVSIRADVDQGGVWEKGNGVVNMTRRWKAGWKSEKMVISVE